MDPRPIFPTSTCTYVTNLLAQKSHLETIINRVNVRNLRSTYRSASTFTRRSKLFKEKNTKSANFFFGVIITVLTTVCVGHFEQKYYEQIRSAQPWKLTCFNDVSFLTLDIVLSNDYSGVASSEILVRLKGGTFFLGLIFIAYFGDLES